jgi:hypothetical protein
VAVIVIGGVIYYLYCRWNAPKSRPSSHNVPVLKLDARPWPPDSTARRTFDRGAWLCGVLTGIWPVIAAAALDSFGTN